MKMLKKAVRRLEGRMALVDSGATHPLREAKPDEWVQSPEVDVVIAGDGVTTMRQNSAGTLLLEPLKAGSKPQTIVPVGNLIGLLGYELSWSRKRCVLRAPDGREEVLKMTSGCPEVNEALALELIAKIEQEKLQQLERTTEESRLALIRAMRVEKDPQWERSLRRFVDTGKFEDGFAAISSMPWATDVMNEDLVRTVSDIPHTESEAWELMKSLGFNRRMRKRMMHKDWVVRFYSGKRSAVDKMFKVFENNGTMVLDIDIMRWSQLDMLKPTNGITTLMLWGAATGRIAATFAAVPRNNTFEHSLRVVVINEVAKMGRKVMCEAVDVPEDGVAMCMWASSQAEEDESSTLWLHKWFRRWVSHSMFEVLHFEQGAYGHPLRRPTTMVTNLDVVELRGGQDRRNEWPSAGASWSIWAPMMVRILVQGMKRWRQRPGWYPRMVKALKAVDRKAWERHLANDHLPHRPDCLHCIHNSTGRPHRRCLHKDCYVMSADTLGPVRVAGPKGEKFAVVFTYQFPRLKMMPEDQPIDEGDLDGWNLDVKTPEKEKEIDGEDLPEDLSNYAPSEPGVPIDEAVKEYEDERGPLPELPTISTTSASKETKIGKATDDWWEFREAEGVLVRHHVNPRLPLFRPTVASGCPVPPVKLEPTRVTEVKFVGGGVDMETSDWHEYKSGARSLERAWTGTTTFRISQAEVAEEEEVLEGDEKSWEALIGDLTKPVEMETIYMVYPVRNRRGGDILLAVQEAVLRLKLLGFPVARLHSDRGSEFASQGLRKWLLERDIFHTRSEALVPQTNGAAERGVRWFKTKAKVLLSEAGVPLKYWTLAMQHASNRQIYYKLGLDKPPLLPFGTSVMIRRKVFGNNKKYDLTDRWEQGTYMGLSDTIKGGAIVLRPTGVLTETLNLRSGVIDPRRLLQDPPEADEREQEEKAIIDLPEPDYRLKGKQAPPELRALRLPQEEEECVLEEGEWSVLPLLEQQERKAREYYEEERFDLQSCGEVLQELCFDGKIRTKNRGSQATSMILGAYVHGGLRGISAEGKKRVWLTKYLNVVLKSKVDEDLHETAAWTTIGVFRAADIPPHRDLRNKPGSLNFAVEIGGTQSGGLWVSEGDQIRKCRGGGFVRDLQKELPDGRILDGKLFNINQKAIAFDPKGEHAYMKPKVERWVLVGFTPLGVDKLVPSAQIFLNKYGFPLHGTGVEVDAFAEHIGDDELWDQQGLDYDSDENELEHRAKVLRCTLQQEVEDERQELLGNCEYIRRLEYAREVCERDLHVREIETIKKMMKISPGKAQDYEVEQLLPSLQAPLEVVHNVSLQEVRKHLSKWVAAIHKEMDALIGSGTIRPLSAEQTRELKKCGLKVLPGKAVFTAKPPAEAGGGQEKEELFRRKCRVVVCGNFLPHGQGNVYASGTSADTLRVSIAYAILRAWTAGCTDISNAFTLAPMPEELLYGVSPPSVVVMAGAAKPGETWKIERVLYGLREAPRLWSLFRNDRLMNARIPYGDKTLVLYNLDTDENLWRVCVEGEPVETIGLMLIYVDDILVLSEPGVIRSIYKWLTAEWKCSALEMLADGPLRFLGVELRLQGGGIHVSQAGYVRDLLRQHGVEERPGDPLTVPCNREWLQDEDTEDENAEPEEATVRMAQKATGEAVVVYAEPTGVGSFSGLHGFQGFEEAVACFGNQQKGHAVPVQDGGLWTLVPGQRRGPAVGSLQRRKFCPWRGPEFRMCHGTGRRDAGFMASVEATHNYSLGCRGGVVRGSSRCATGVGRCCHGCGTLREPCDAFED